MNSHLCLKWNNHSTAFIKSINSVKIKEKYSDATIICQGNHYSVHKLILSTCSEYFEEMFEEIRCEHPYIVFRDIEHEDIELLLNYMYQGEVNVIQEKLPTLIKTAEALKVKGLAVPDEVPSKSKDETSSGKKRPKNSDGYFSSKKKLKGKSFCEPSSAASTSVDNIFNRDCNTLQSNNEEDLPIPTSCIKSEFQDEFEYNGSMGRNTDTIDSTDHYPTAELESNIKEDPHQLENEDILQSNSDRGSQSETLITQGCFWTDFDNFSPPQNSVSQNSRPQEDRVGNQEHHSSAINLINKGNDKVNAYESNDSSFTLHQNKYSSGLYKCPSCDYRSNDITQIKTHVRIKHSQDRPFQCQYCSVRFNKKAYLRIHLRMHTGERPYKCQSCPMSFSTKSNLNRHKKSFHAQDVS